MLNEEVLTAPTKDAGTDITKVASDIQSGLAVFESRKAAVAAKVEKYSSLTIKDANDKEGYKAVKEARLDLMRERTATEKEGKLMRDPLTQTNKFISSKEKELIEVSQGEEQRLAALEKNHEAELERIKQEELQKELNRKQGMVDQLTAYGMPITIAQLENITDEQFQESLAFAKEAFDKKEEERLAEEMREMATKARIGKLIEAGFSYDGNNYFVSDFKRLDPWTISLLSDRDFEEVLTAGIREIERIEDLKKAEAEAMRKEREELDRIKAEQEEVAKRQKEEQDKIDAEKRRIEEEKQEAERLRLKEIEDKRRADELEQAKAKAAEEARLKAIQDAKAAEEKRLEDERKKKEAEERKAARQPDKIKIQNYIKSIQDIVSPELKSEDGRQAFKHITTELNKVFQSAGEIISAL